MPTNEQIQELEEKLKILKSQEHIQQLQREYDSVKDMEGKCFGSHTFTRPSKSGYQTACYFEKIWVENNEVKVLQWTVSMSQNQPNGYAYRKRNISYNRYCQTQVIYPNANGYNAHYSLMQGIYKTTEISLPQFMQLWEAGNQASDIIRGTFDGILPEVRYENIDGNSHDDSLSNGFKTLGIEIIDFKDFPTTWKALEYCHLPFFQQDRFLPRIFARDVLEYQIRLWNSGPQNAWTHSKINTIREFIQDHLY